MSYSTYQLSQRINNLQNQINNAPVQTLQTVLNAGNSATSQSIELTDGTSSSILNNTTLSFSDNAGSSDLTYTDNNLYINGQTTFNLPPHSTTPILGNDLTTKDYVDSLVGQYSGGFNLFLNYSQTVVVNSISYKSLSAVVTSAVDQIVPTITDGTNQLIASFITDPINILEIPVGLWNMSLNGGVSSAGGVLNYFFKLRRYRAGFPIGDLVTSGNSPDINATPSSNPDIYHMNATISTAIPLQITDRLIIEIYCIKTSGVSVTLNTYFEGSYYSFVQTTLNAGTTLLSSSNNWTGSNTFSNNMKINSSLTDTTGSVGTLGQFLSTTVSGVSWISQPASGSTYASYTASATLSTTVNPRLLVLFSGSTVGQTLTIPPLSYSVGQVIQFKNNSSVNVTISSGSTSMYLYSLSPVVTSYTLIPYDSFNVYYTGFSYIQYTPSNTFSKIVGSNGCIAGQTNFISVNTSSLPYTVSTIINLDMFVLLTGSTALQVLSIPVASNIGQKFTIKNRASVDVSLSFPSSNIMLFDSLSEVGVTAVILKSKGTISIYWAGSYWIQIVPSNTMPELTTTGNISASAGSVSASTTLSAGTTITAGSGITSTSGNIVASAGSVSASTTLSAGTTITAGSGITTTSGNISASAGSVSASTTLSAGSTITAGSGITSTSGNIVASAGSISASTTLSAGTTITAGSGITSTSGNIVASAGSVSASTTLSAGTTITAGSGITATTGNITATSGDISASGNITGTTSLNTPTINPISATNNISMCPTQTSGILNIGVGNRTKTSGTGEGNINIGTGNNTITSGSVGPTINIGSNTALTNLTEISIGATNTKTTINGPLTLTGTSTVQTISGSGLFTTSGNITTTGTGGFSSANDITLASSKYITTSHTGTITAPTALQVGYIQSVSYTLPTVPATLNLLTMNSITLSQGVWILKGAVSITASTTITYGFVSFGDTSRPAGVTPVVNDSLYGSVSFNGVPVATNEKVIPNLISFVSPLVSTTYYFNIYLVGSGSGYNSQNWRLQATRIA